MLKVQLTITLASMIRFECIRCFNCLNMKICFKAFDYIGWNESCLNNVNPSFDGYMLFDFWVLDT